MLAVELVLCAILLGITYLLWATYQSQLRTEKHMGATAVALAEINFQLSEVSADLDEAATEIPAEIKKLTDKIDAGLELDAEDKAALAAISEKAAGLKDASKKLADVVPNAVVVPLPDPTTDEATTLDPSAPDVLDPGTFTPATPDDAAAEDTKTSE